MDTGGGTRRRGSGVSRLHEIVTAYKFATLQNYEVTTRLDRFRHQGSAQPREDVMYSPSGLVPEVVLP